MQFFSRCCALLQLQYLTAFLTVCVTLNAHAQDTSKTIPSFNIPHSPLQATIDGELDDDIWNHAREFSLNIVNSPLNNTKSPVATTAKIIENGENIYISFVALDPNPDEIQAFLGDRDSRWGDDIVGIKLDTFNNRRLNYEFFVNPFGVQHDSIKNVMNGTSNDSWNGIWDSYGKITNTGYQVEIAIPYRILNFKNTNDMKTWAFELVRLYPRDTRLRISHIPLDRNNDCWLCQMPELIGFKEAKTGKNLMVTPAIVANKNDTTDIFDENDNWHSDNSVDAGVDVRWGINSNTLFNMTVNPDFSTVEVDAGQLNINKTYSLFYDEKRAFFLENADYFSSNYDLVYTRNIADPDFGAKLTGTIDKHSYAMFVTNDTQTNFIVPGNTGSELASLDTNSHSAAFRYRYDVNNDLSIGAINTLRRADNYHNVVFGVDTKYRVDESNSFQGQVLNSNTEYPKQLFQDFCMSNDDTDCQNKKDVDCIFGNCQFTEQVHRTKIDGDFSDSAFKASYNHKSEYWDVTAEHQSIGKNFRADLGYMPRADYQSNKFAVDHYIYGNENSLWQEAKLSGQWQIKHNEKGELLEKSVSSTFSIDGPYQSNAELTVSHEDKVGLRHNEALLTIDNNTSRFTENVIQLYGNTQLTNQLYVEAEFKIGDKIDYRNNRLGDYQELYTNVSYNFNQHLQADVYFTTTELDADNANVYQANLTELRVSYQFDVHSYLKLNVVYSDIDRNPDNNPYVDVSHKNKNLSTQLIYAYKLNAQTVFYLGYSDGSYQNDALNNLEREQRTFFTKISYAWMP